MSDSFIDGSKVSVINVIVVYNQLNLGFDIGRWLPATIVIRCLEGFINFHGKSKRICILNGKEYTSDYIQHRSNPRVLFQPLMGYIPSPKHFSTNTITLDSTDCSRTRRQWGLYNAKKPYLEYSQ